MVFEPLGGWFLRMTCYCYCFSYRTILLAKPRGKDPAMVSVFACFCFRMFFDVQPYECFEVQRQKDLVGIQLTKGQLSAAWVR